MKPIKKQENSESVNLYQGKYGQDPSSGSDDFKSQWSLNCTNIHLWQNFNEEPISFSRDRPMS